MFAKLKPIDGYHVITPEALSWRPSDMMQIPSADLVDRTGSQLLGARFWRLPPRSANTLHRHIRAEEFYFVLEGIGRMRVATETITIPKHGGVLVGPSVIRQIFNDTDADTLWLIVGAPDAEMTPDELANKQLYFPVDPKQLPSELAGVEWPPKP